MARIGIFGDIHGNLKALKDVLHQMRDEVDEYICLGDYTAEQEDDACIQEIIGLKQRAPFRSVGGNHDEQSLNGHLDSRLSPESMSFLKHLPESLQEGRILITHANPLERAKHGKGVWREGEYIDSLRKAQIVLEECSHEIIVVGHIHKPIVYTETECVNPVNNPIKLNSVGRCIISPGAVGYSRQAENTAHYGIFHREQMTFEVKKVKTSSL